MVPAQRAANRARAEGAGAIRADESRNARDDRAVGDKSDDGTDRAEDFREQRRTSACEEAWIFRSATWSREFVERRRRARGAETIESVADLSPGRYLRGGV